MDGENEDGGTGTQVQDGEAAQGEQNAPQAEQGQGGEGAKAPQVVKAPDFAKQLAEKDEIIADLQSKVADAAKTIEGTKRLSDEIQQLKKAIADERTDFALQKAGCRSVKAARALLDDHGGDVAALAEAEPWLFETPETKPRGGSTGLEPAGAAGGDDERTLERWARIAGLDGDDVKGK